MDNKITFITAFFDIGRRDWNAQTFSRSNDKYLNYFSQWAGFFPNDLIIYTNVKEMIPTINSIRNDSKGKTNIVFIDDISNIAPEIYASLKNVNIEKMKPFRLLPDNPEVVNFEYNYLMMLKHVLVLRSIERFKISDNVGWIDFGISHIVSDDLALFSTPLIVKNKLVNVFSPYTRNELLSFVTFDRIFKMDTPIYGSLFYGPIDAISAFSKKCIQNQSLINKIGLMDDDQITMFMSFKDDPQNVDVKKCNWNDILLLAYGANPKNTISRITAFKRIARRFKRRALKNKNVRLFKKDLFDYDWPK